MFIVSLDEHFPQSKINIFNSLMMPPPCFTVVMVFSGLYEALALFNQKVLSHVYYDAFLTYGKCNRDF